MFSAQCTGSQRRGEGGAGAYRRERAPGHFVRQRRSHHFLVAYHCGNEKAVGWIQNNLVRMGCELVTDGDALVHVTGHPRR